MAKLAPEIKIEHFLEAELMVNIAEHVRFENGWVDNMDFINFRLG
jgi:hypothetical protein